MDWSSQRKFLYLGTLFGIFFLIVGTFVYFKFFNNPPSCSDGILNQDERGVDCGGVCALLCPSESRPPIVQFSRLFNVKPGEYSVLALVENPNQNVYAKKLDYVFKIYDTNNILLSEVFGTTFAPPGRVFPIFEHSIYTGYREASKVTLDIASGVEWTKGEFVDPDVRISNEQSANVDTRYRVTADITNKEVYPMRNIPVYAIVYDDKSNVREASFTLVEYLSPTEDGKMVFTWNHNFDFDISKIDLIPRPLPREWQTK